MAIFSKPVKVTHTCYEVGHCWTPYCTTASIDVAKGVFAEALKIYSTLYFVTAILKKRGLNYYIEKLIPEILRSTTFLTLNGGLFIASFCIWRKLTGFYFLYNVLLCGPPLCALAFLVEHKERRCLGGLYYVTSSFLPCFFASIAAVLVERKPRRGPLALYVTNLALETAFRMMLERKWVSPIPHGEVYLFSVVSAIYLYLFRKQNGLSKSAESIFRFFVGGAENPQVQEPKKDSQAVTSSGQGQGRTDGAPTGTESSAQSSKEESSSNSKPENGPSNRAPVASRPSKERRPALHRLLNGLESLPLVGQCLRTLQERLVLMMKVVESWPQHRCCQHKQSCVAYVVKGGSRMFAFGYAIQCAISVVSHASAIWRKPAALKDVVLSKANLSLAAFLGGYSAIFRMVNCLLRWVRDKDSEFHGLLAGGLAGLSMYFYKSVTIALYAATKLAEILYFKGIENHWLPYIKHADILLYAFSTAWIFHAAVMEPHTLRPGYWKFLLRVTRNKFAYMNRRLLEPFGVNSAKIAPDHWPDYDPAFTSLTRPKS